MQSKTKQAIARTSEHPSEVDRLWVALKPKYKPQEFVADPKQGWAGIGVLQVPG